MFKNRVFLKLKANIASFKKYLKKLSNISVNLKIQDHYLILIRQ